MKLQTNSIITKKSKERKHATWPIVQYILIGNPVNIYLLKVNNKSTTRRCEIFSNLTIKTPEWHH